LVYVIVIQCYRFIWAMKANNMDEGGLCAADMACQLMSYVAIDINNN